MYSDIDIDDAVAAGVLSADSAAALRRHVAERHAGSVVDDEQFRLVTGFNDIFVSIAAILLLGALAWIGSTIPLAGPVGTLQLRPLGGLFVAVAAWGLAEYFTRIRRMALPSILLLLFFVGGVFATCASVVAWAAPASGASAGGILIAVCAAISAVAAAAHWRRFHVPITIAAGAAGVAGTIVGVGMAIVPGLQTAAVAVALATGVAVFAFAMWWDMSDPARETRRSDVAFWLHLLAAPLIVHPVFKLLGVLDGGATAGEAVIVLLLYALLAVVALAVDRRALMVSALFYVLYALSILFREFGALSLNLALTGLVIGSALLLLSAFWHGARGAVVRLFPEGLRAHLPPTGPVRAMVPTRV